jgi:hypothetical protein
VVSSAGYIFGAKLKKNGENREKTYPKSLQKRFMSQKPNAYGQKTMDNIVAPALPDGDNSTGTRGQRDNQLSERTFTESTAPTCSR